MMTSGEVSYYHTISNLDSILSSSIIPAVVIHAEEDDNLVSAAYIQAVLERFGEKDDVFTPKFADSGVLIVIYDTNQPPLSAGDSFTEFTRERFVGGVIFQKTKNKARWLEGPYFLQGKDIHQAWRLYPDYLGAFTTAVVPAESSSLFFQPLKCISSDGLHPAVAVPSRLHSPISAEKPLNGLRIAVKDNYHLAGTVTTHGSRSYAKCYGVQSTTSTYVERLIEMGCIVVGKTKLSSFAGTEVPPKGPIDYLAPFNPRGDLYQNPAGSSMGAAAAVAGYDWLDVSLATDTTGSTRAPAANNGVWGMRTTWGTFPMDGIIPSAKPFDTVGLLARDAAILHQLLKPYEHALISGHLPTQILYPTDWLPIKNEKQQKMIDKFTSCLETFLGTTRTEISLSNEWTKSAPEPLRGTKLADYLRKTGYWINMYDGYHNFGEFRDLYEQKFNEAPYISPVQTSKWESGRLVTPEQRAEAVEQSTTFKNWIKENIIKDGTTIMVVAVGNPGPSYRDELPPPVPSGPGGSYNANFFATILGLPQIIVPVGQLPFTSKVTKRTEYIPVVAGLVGGAGMDDTLVRVAMDALNRAGWPVKVLAGRRAFAFSDEKSGAAGEDQIESAKM
ncbi:amidase, putative [Talaromyces stipitatus ATCC 10500]|uniref:Amidase, putative n=1 Tax=Talaromyces stipitatus (strain ATCC 10500 / CBS 375.48 / QM 6759 / NRRL 1006) TaxID=441959 RepID=B8LXV1_TALSN|nr:amidase, putative [Talaromyces stipitatus ATCC 10500]EED22766.1 amidase, putative [Talaromyces stipitatus ATCC 10500]